MGGGGNKNLKNLKSNYNGLYLLNKKEEASGWAQITPPPYLSNKGKIMGDPVGSSILRQPKPKPNINSPNLT